MRVIDHLETLIYYDGPQLFLARDQFNASYVCVLVDQSDAGDRFLCVPATNDRIHAVTTGQFDLRELFSAPEVQELTIVEDREGSLRGLEGTPISIADVPDAWLPRSGTYLRAAPVPEGNLLREATSRHRAVIRCELDPPEAKDESKISVGHLSEAIRLFQRVVRRAYQKAIRDLDTSVRETLLSPGNYELEVFATSGGSFTLHMQTVEPADLLGYAQVAKAFELLDFVTESVGDIDVSVPRVSELGGHFATAFKDLLGFLAESSTAISYEWTIPERKDTTIRTIPAYQAKPLHDALAKRLDIGREERILRGRLTKVDEKRLSWRMVSLEDQREYSGTSEVDLAGLTIETVVYEFRCEERLEEEAGTGRERTIYVLTSFNQA